MLTIWILTVGEPLPTDSVASRLMRTGQLAGVLANSGHHVTWWNSSFDHTRKLIRHEDGKYHDSNLKYKVCLLKGDPYYSNVSLARVRNHRQIAADFSKKATSLDSPDIILASYPTLELCEAALDYALPRNIPVVIDIRDLWPDIFLNLAPSWARFFAKMALLPLYQSSRRIFSNCSGIIGITDAFVDWGCSRGRRRRGSFDKSFPLAYSTQLLEHKDLVNARVMWDSLGLDSTAPIVCFFGTLGRQFDIPCILEAASYLQDTGLKFVICGLGDNFEKYIKLSECIPNVYFPGWVDAPAILALMERSIAGLAPYFNEESFTMNIPNKPIEYMAGGLPIVSTLRGQLQYLLNSADCGITVPSGDSRAVADALRSLLVDTQARERMANNARNLYETNFKSEVVYKQLGDFLCEIATLSR
jgi:glycosyltransferase involved in cell wall biosynthesis